MSLAGKKAAVDLVRQLSQASKKEAVIVPLKPAPPGFISLKILGMIGLLSARGSWRLFRAIYAKTPIAPGYAKPTPSFSAALLESRFLAATGLLTAISRF